MPQLAVDLTRKQLESIGPVRTVPTPQELAKKEPSVEKIKQDLADCQTLAAVAQSPGFMAYIDRNFRNSVAALLSVKTDADRQTMQLMAKIWLTIQRDLQSAAERQMELQEKLSALSK